LIDSTANILPVLIENLKLLVYSVLAEYNNHFDASNALAVPIKRAVLDNHRIFRQDGELPKILGRRLKLT